MSIFEGDQTRCRIDKRKLPAISALCVDMVLNQAMEKIDPQNDHERLSRYCPGTQVRFKGKPYKIQRRTTLASGEAAVVLEGEREQFVISANQFLAGVRS
jgi:hypothetical protein